MIFYVSLLLVIALFATIIKPDKSKGRAKAFAIVAFGCLGFVSAVRSIDVGVDTLQYCSNYQVIAFIDWANYDTLRYEPAFFALCKTLNYISSDYRLLIAVSSAIIFAGVSFFYYKLTEDPLVTVFLFVTLLIDAFLMSGMRQALAMSVALVGLYHLLKGRRVLFCVLVLLAAQFHSSAIVCLAYWPLLNRKFSTKAFVLIVAASAVAFVFAHQLYDLASGLIGKYEGYLENANHAHGGSNYFGALMRAGFFFFVLLVAHYCLKDSYGTANERSLSASSQVGINVSFLMYVGMLAFFFNVLGMQVEIFSRMNNYFNIFLPLLIPCAFNRLSEKKEVPIIKYVSLSLCLAYFSAILILRPEWNGIVPYSTFFSERNQ